MKKFRGTKSFPYVKAHVYCERIFDGTHESPKPCEKGTHKLITSQNISSGSINQDGAYYISEEDYNAIQKRSATKKGDLLFSMIGTVGNTCIIDTAPNFAIKNMGCFRCRTEDDTNWLFYYLNSGLGKANLQLLMKGSIQKYITLEMLQNFPVLEKPANYKTIIQIIKSIDSQIKKNIGMVQKLQYIKPFINYLSIRGGMAYVC